MKLFKISPGSLGGKIKRFRKLHGWSQKQLGLKCGFSDSSADVRIAQYESNQKVPREKVLNDIADALNVDVNSFSNADFYSFIKTCYALFDMEDFHGLHPVKIDSRYYLDFSGPKDLPTNLGNCVVSPLDYQGFLKSWYEMREKYGIGKSNEKLSNYILSRSNFHK